MRRDTAHLLLTLVITIAVAAGIGWLTAYVLSHIHHLLGI
jgi:hypothetical protein